MHPNLWLPDVWTHTATPSPSTRKTKQIIFLGRSDNIFNSSRVRFGSSEIHKVIDTRFPKEITNSICAGQRRRVDTGEAVMLSLVMRPGQLLSPVKEAIRAVLSTRHAPKCAFEPHGIPVYRARLAPYGLRCADVMVRRLSISRKLSSLLSILSRVRSSSSPGRF
jgi:hypothetical protein